MNILIFSSIYNFQKYLLGSLVWPSIRSNNICLTVNELVVVNFEVNWSCSWDKFTIISRWHKCNDRVHLYQLETFPNPMFRGTGDETSSTQYFSIAQCCKEKGTTKKGVSPEGMCLSKNRYPYHHKLWKNLYNIHEVLPKKENGALSLNLRQFFCTWGICYVAAPVTQPPHFII
jgi:hypothetical protein